MYTPKHFAIDDLAACHDLIDANSFGVLVVADPNGGLEAAHLPFLLKREEGEQGTLYAHVAKANPIWRMFDGGEVLCIFSGPHAYVSPTWYETEPGVPTWNYASVHCSGVPELATDTDETAAQMADLSAAFEQGTGWTFSGLPDSYRRGMIKGIVGFRVPISSLTGKAKMSQNRTDGDVDGARKGLMATGDAMDAATADMMQSLLKPRD